MKEILKKLCTDKGVSGSETEMLSTVRELIGDFTVISADASGNIIAATGSGQKHIMLDAHMDRIGLVITYIDENGFLKAEPVGGIDLRSLPGAAVRILGREGLLGMICTVPPHLEKESGELSRDKIWIDTGLPAKKVKELVSLGDKAVLCSSFKELLGDRVAVSALDDRSGCAVLIRCAQLLRDKELPCRVSFVFSSQEETGELGAGTSAFTLAPDEAVAVDVGFAAQEGVPPEKSGKLGCGAIISISPVLSRAVTDKLIEISKRLSMDIDYEVCGGSTGTNADRIAASRGGVRTGCISIPSKNMHTPAEIVALGDMEKLAELLAIYISEGGAANA